MSLAVKVDAVATPVASVPTVTWFEPLPAKVPLAPLAGELKSTQKPASWPVKGQPLLLASATCRSFLNGFSSCAVCGLPAAILSMFGRFTLGQAPAAPAVSELARRTPTVAARPREAARRRTGCTHQPRRRRPRRWIITRQPSGESGDRRRARGGDGRSRSGRRGARCGG